MKRPSKGDRWQHRKTSRVCTVEAIEGGPDAITSVVVYRYEDSTRYEDRAYGGRRARRRVGMTFFTVSHVEFEKATP